MSKPDAKRLLSRFRAEILSEAVAICRGQPFGDLRQPRIAHLHGVLAAQKGRFPLAIAYFTHAIRLAPSDPGPSIDLGAVLQRQGRTEEAIAAYLRAVTCATHDAEGYAGLARVLREQGRVFEAAAMYSQALMIRPDNANLHGELGDTLCAANRWDDALECYRTALLHAPDDPDAHRRLGQMQSRRREWVEALASFRRGLELDPTRADLHVGAGEALLKRGLISDAESEFYAALEHSPGDIVASRQYVFVLELLGRCRDAVGAWAHLGAALAARGRLDEAVAAYQQALARKPDCLRALLHLGRAQIVMGHVDEAVESYEAAVAANRERALSHVELGLALHAAGEHERGWDELARYHDPRGKTWRHVEQPVWDGSPLHGRWILLWADDETSERDAIYFLRFARFAKDLGGRVIVECAPALVRLVEQMPEVDYVMSTGGPLIPFDVHTPLRFLPALIRSARSWSPSDARYLSVDVESARTWREQLVRDGERTVGVVWAGEYDDRSPPLEFASLRVFAHIREIPTVRLISLQHGPHAHELLAPPAGLHVAALLDDSHRLDQVAAVIDNLDLVIGVDAPVVHLAAALGKPVWVLLPHAARWPWPAHGEHPQQYPTVRLFRRTRGANWDEVLMRVRRELEHVVGHATSAGVLAR